MGQQGEGLGDAVDDLGHREDVLAPAGPGGAGAPDPREHEDPSADQGVPVLVRGGLRRRAGGRPLRKGRPRSRRSAWPTGRRRRGDRACASSRNRRAGRRSGSRASDRRSGPAQLGGGVVEPVVDQVEAAAGLGGGVVVVAPPVRAAGDRDLDPELAERVGEGLPLVGLDRLPASGGRWGRSSLRIRSRIAAASVPDSLSAASSEVEQRELAGQGDPGQDGVVAEGQAGLGVDVREQGLGGLPRGLADARVEGGGGPAAGRELPAVGDRGVAVAEPPGGLQLDRDVDPPRLEGGDQVVEPGQGVGVEFLGVVPGVVEEAPGRAERGVEVGEPDEVHARSGQAVGQGVGPGVVGREGGRGQERDAEEPGPAPLGERQAAVLDGDEPVLARRGVEQARGVERRLLDDRRRRGDREPVGWSRSRRGSGSTGSGRRRRATWTSSIQRVP